MTKLFTQLYQIYEQYAFGSDNYYVLLGGSLNTGALTAGEPDVVV